MKFTSNEKGIPTHYEFANFYSEGETNLVKKNTPLRGASHTELNLP